MRTLWISFGLILALVLTACTGAPRTENFPKSEVPVSLDSLSDFKTPEQISLPPNLPPSRVDTVVAAPLDSTPTIPAEEKRTEAETETVDDADIYVDIPRLARQALARADSFYKAGTLDSALAILEKFSVLNPLWEEWQMQAKNLSEKIKASDSQKEEKCFRLLIDLKNAQSRRAAYAEIKQIADSVRTFSLNDSLSVYLDSMVNVAFARSFQKAQSARDSALALAREKADFLNAEKRLTELLLHFPDFADTLNLRGALVTVANLQQETSLASAAYWNSHDPQKELENARKWAKEKKWQMAKEMYQKLKSSNLRGDALRDMDSLYVDYCTEKRKNAANYFAEYKRASAKVQNKAEKLHRAIAELDACLEFAPEYKERSTVISNRQFLQSELQK